jgi:signal transduction histidine kinase
MVLGQPLSAKEIKEFILLNSYHTGYKWTDDLTLGVLDGIGSPASNRVFVEYMDYKRFQNKQSFYELINLYKYKYQELDIDGIICADNYAFQFFLENGDSIWDKNIPVNVCGVNNIENFTYDTLRCKAIREDLDVKNTLNSIFTLNPHTDTLLVISDQTLSGKIFLQQFVEGINKFYPSFPYQIIDGTDYEHIHSKLQKIYTKNKAIVLLSLYSNRYKIPLEMKHVGRDLLKGIEIPVYSFWEFLMDDFIVGGSLISSYDQGYAAAQNLSFRITNPSVKTLALQKSRYRLAFDYNKIKEYNLAYENLPDKAILINKEIPFYIKHKNKIIFYLSILLVLILLNFFLANNISRRKKIEQKLKMAKEKAEESDRLKSSFLANMSHEIRTPMNAILGFSDILQSSNLDNSENYEYLEQIKNSGENLLNIINDIVDVSKIESGQLQIKKEHFELDKLIENIEYTIKTLIKTKNKAITFSIINNPEQKVQKIFADPFRIEQVLLNLLTNAVKFTDQGEIKLSIIIKPNQNLLFEVSDTGDGIDPEDLEIIFERFRQAEKTTKMNAGTGLGLTITRSLVKLMDGTIRVQSKPNVGTTFTIELPFLEN